MAEFQRHKILEKAMLILEYAAKHPEGVSFTQIVSELGLPKSSAHNLITTFEDMGYLDKDTGNHHYRIGLKAFEIGSAFSENNGFFPHIKSILKELVDEVGETAHLATLDGRDVVYINKYDCSHAVRMISHIGKRVPAHATAIGKAILASRSEEEILGLYGEELEVLTPCTIRTRDALLEELRSIRQTGFATEREESTPGIQCIALKVENDKMQTDIAISVAVPLSRAEKGMDCLKGPLLEAREKLQAMQ